MKSEEILKKTTHKIFLIQIRTFAIAVSLIGGACLFLMTAWLLIKGGENTGQHLTLLNQYFWGYSVTWPGAFIGFLYGAFVSAIAGFLIGYLYNRIARNRL